MPDHDPIPTLLTFLFGDSARAARRAASERMLLWCGAFDDWLLDRRARFRSDSEMQARRAWRRLLQERGKTPWELSQEDIEAHCAWLQERGYSPATVANAVGYFSSFYRWCAGRGVDPGCDPAFNPAAQVARPRVQRYRGATLLSRSELEQLLRTIRSDQSPLGGRDYALVLARLHLGAPLQQIQRLQWCQVEQDGGKTWLRWRPGAGRQPLADEAWQAIRLWLEAGGRLADIQPQDYLFTPLAQPWDPEAGARAQDWLRGRCLSLRQVGYNLKLYGRLAGLPDEKLTMQALRRTALRLQLEQVGSLENQAGLEQLQGFLDTRIAPRQVKNRLKSLPDLPEDGPPAATGQRPAPPNRKVIPFQPGQGVRHGLYARSHPPGVVQGVIQEHIQGVDEEIVGLRILARGLLDLQGQARTGLEVAQVGEAYSRAASRLSVMMRIEKELQHKSKESQWAERFTEMLNLLNAEFGGVQVTHEQMAEIAAGGTGVQADARRMVEEVAATRYILRNTFRLAGESDDLRESLRLVDIYGEICVRLARLLRAQKGETDGLVAYYYAMIDRAILEVNEEFDAMYRADPQKPLGMPALPPEAGDARAAG